MPLVRRRSYPSVEAVESRVLFNATYVALSAGAFTQDWSNTSLISSPDDWTNVIGVVGFKGDGLVSGTGQDPQNITGTNTTQFVLANQATPTISAGGVAEFQITDPVVAIKGSGSANAPYLQFHLDTTGMKDVVVSYNLRDIDGGSNNSVQPVALQYRVGESGNWINVPAAFVADASAGPTQLNVTPVSVTLPAAANDQSKVQVRVITADAVGSDEYIGVDDINISATSNVVIPSLVLNEVNVNPPTSADSAFEYVELKGTASQNISNVYVVGVDGDQFDIGTVTVSIPLNNVSFGSNGLMFIKGTTGGFASEDAASTVVVNSGLTGGVLYNGSFSILVVYSPTPINAFDILDQDGNGTLESLPGGAQIIDSISWKAAGSTGDVIYGTELVASASVTPDAASRLPTNTTPNDAGAWYYGDLNNTDGNASKGYLAGASFNLPAGDARLTPGASNFAAPGAPGVQSASFAYDNRPMALLVDFDKDVSASLVLSDGSDSSFILTNRDTSTPVPAASISKAWSTGDIATLRFPGFSGSGGTGTLPDGNYRLTVVAANVKDAGNTPMTADVTYDFYVLNGDATRDRKVDTEDFNILAAYFGSGAQVFSHGDFNYDSVVDSTDFALFVGQYGKTLAALPGAVAGSAIFSALDDGVDASDARDIL